MRLSLGTIGLIMNTVSRVERSFTLIFVSKLDNSFEILRDVDISGSNVTSCIWRGHVGCEPRE